MFRPPPNIGAVLVRIDLGGTLCCTHSRLLVVFPASIFPFVETFGARWDVQTSSARLSRRQGKPSAVPLPPCRTARGLFRRRVVGFVGLLWFCKVG